MNRFFSKLDLRDIKIDPNSSRFPPDAEEELVEAVEEGDRAGSDEQPFAAEPVNGAADFDPALLPEETVSGSAERPDHEPSWSQPTPVAEAPSIANESFEEDVQPVTDGVIGYAATSADDVTIAAQPGPNGHVEVLKVSARSRPSAVAGAIAGVVRESGRAEVQAIGAGATNQAVKAVAIARDYLRETGIEAICLPAFIDVTIENEDRTAIRLVVEPR